MPGGVAAYDSPTAFAEYLQGGQQRQLGDVRSSYEGLQQYLSDISSKGFNPNLNPNYFQTYGGVPDKSQILQSSLAALGSRGSGSRGEQNLGNLYDMFEMQYGAQGASKFADMIGGAYGYSRPPQISTPPPNTIKFPYDPKNPFQETYQTDGYGVNNGF